METAFNISHYVALAVLIGSMCFVLPRYIYKRIKTDSLRDAQHFEVCILASVLTVLTSAGLTIITYNV